jgi:hypothetical protein
MAHPDSSTELPKLVSVPDFNKAVFGRSMLSYQNLFEDYCSSIERELLSSSSRLHRVTMPHPDSSIELLKLVLVPNYGKAVFGGSMESPYFNLFDCWSSYMGSCLQQLLDGAVFHLRELHE